MISRLDIEPLRSAGEVRDFMAGSEACATEVRLAP